MNADGKKTTVTSSYDWQGQRRSKTGPNGTLNYLWGVEGLLQEGSLVYERAGDLVTGIGSERVYHDALGSVAARDGAMFTPYRYDPWGGFRSGTGPGVGDATLAYGNRHWDRDASLYWGGQRWNMLWRFLSTDPVQGDIYNPTSLPIWDAYNGNPLRYTDPEGEAANLVTAGIGAAIGAIGGCAIGAWNAESGHGWGGCAKGGAVGAGAGGLAGLTFGLSLAATGAVGIGGTAVVGGGTTGSVLIAGTTAGAVGGATGAAANVLVEGGSAQQAYEMGTIGAFTGSVGGAFGSAAGVGVGTYVGTQTGSQLAGGLAGGAAGGFFGDLPVQGVLMAGGVQQDFSFAQLGLSTGLGMGVGGAYGFNADWKAAAQARARAQFLSEELASVQVESEPHPSRGGTELTVSTKSGRISGVYVPGSEDLHIDIVNTMVPKQGVGTLLYEQLIGAAGKIGRVRSVSGYMAMDNQSALRASGGDIAATPRAKILSRLGYTRHTYNPKTKLAVSTLPGDD